jgi:4-amino-4-deoxy-L-arabinose transferase-like glycosyltransferase
MTEHSSRWWSNWGTRLSLVLLVLGLILFHAINNWIWLTKNVASRGWDRMNALVNSLLYSDTLSRISLHALFKASVQDEVRPPLFATSMALMYKFFGVSTDVAVMVNVVYLAILVAASYGIGKKLGTRWSGLLSAFLVVALPLVFSMSRYAYFEFALTALVALSVYLLLASDGFQKRRNALLLGLVLGLGALLKRTFPVFVLGAIGVAALQAGLLPKFWSRLHRKPHIRWRDVGLALGGGLLLSALWYLPNQDLAQALPTGPWIFPVWWGLAAITIYFVLQPPSEETNFVACGALGMSVASLWYLPHASFIQRALRAGWGVDDPRGRTVNLLNPVTYTEYLRSIVIGISLFYTLLLLFVAAMLVFIWLRRRPALNLVELLHSKWWLIVVSVLLPYLILSTSIYQEDRAVTPILPFLAIILAAMLLKLPWRPLRITLIFLAVAFGLVQFFAISYTEAHGLVVNTAFESPLLGQAGLFAQGPYIEMPDSGLNDPRFWIVDDVLSRVEATRLGEGWDTISMGVLAGSSYVHASVFVYDQIRLYPHIQIENPLQAYPADSPYATAFRYDYLVILEQFNRGEAMRQVTGLILNERRPFFEQGFKLETRYNLPDGDTAYLFQRRYRPSDAYNGDALYEVAQYLGQEATGDDLVAVAAPGLVDSLLESYWGPAPIAVVSGEGTLSQELVLPVEGPGHVFLLSDHRIDPGALETNLVPAGLSEVEEFQFGGLWLAIWKADGS